MILLECPFCASSMPDFSISRKQLKIEGSDNRKSPQFIV